MNILVTGGAGFIGSALVRHIVNETDHRVCVVDKLTYAGDLSTLREVADSPRYRFEALDITDGAALGELFASFEPDAVMHLAAETHVDRSIDDPSSFIDTNVVGSFQLLEAVRHYWRALPAGRAERFRFLHVSTDEVYGSLGAEGRFSEASAYDPRSPYSASKAASDQLARAWFHTYDLPVLVTNCSNNYGPYQYPEKLVPVVILRALAGERVPVYGRGENVRDWLYVDDHVRALLAVLERGRTGETYVVGADNERTSLAIAETICDLLDRLAPDSGRDHRSLIAFVTDRPGHDHRYAIDAAKLRSELGWRPRESFASGLEKTVRWYLDNLDWCREVLGGSAHLERLGLARS